MQELPGGQMPGMDTVSDCIGCSVYKPVISRFLGVFQSSLYKLLSDFLISRLQNAQSIITGRFHDHFNFIVRRVISSLRASSEPFGIFPAFSLAMLISTRMINTSIYWLDIQLYCCKYIQCMSGVYAF